MSIFVAPAVAQPNVECKKTETQAECHARLKCKADEEVEQCQKRLRSGQRGDRADDGGGRDDGGRRDDGGGRDDRRGGRDDRGDDGGSRGRDDRADRGDRGDDRGSRRRRGRTRDGGRRRDGKGYETIKTFGLGLEVGEPSGIGGKYFLSDSRALDFGVGWIYSHYYYGDGVHLYLDHLWHPVSLASTPAFELPLYIGIGARYWDFEYCERRGGIDICDTGSALGLRVPIGISFDLNNAPLDIFLQLIPVIDLLYGDYYDRFDDRGHFGIDGSVGIRFWFK